MRDEGTSGEKVSDVGIGGEERTLGEQVRDEGTPGEQGKEIWVSD